MDKSGTAANRRLAQDPLRTILKRTQLVLAVGEGINTRKHVKLEGRKYNDKFWLQVDKLAVVDLWNLFLLDEMLGRARTQVHVNLLAEGDFRDKNTAWEGLIFYRNGEAEAPLWYPNERRFKEKLEKDRHDCLCRWFGHFDKPDGAGDVGPSEQELARAAKENHYGLILTRVGKRSFVAHYFNPGGVVISLGRYPLRTLDKKTRDALTK